jgi:hypothetical protein
MRYGASEPQNTSMKKSVLERFINKYRLNGLIDSAVWIVSKGMLRVSAVNWGNQPRAVVADVTFRNFDSCDEVQIGVSDPKKVLALLNAIRSEHVSFDTIKYSSGDVAVVVFSDGERRAEYVAANPKNMGSIPVIKNIPPWNCSIVLDDKFNQWFLGVFKMLKDQTALFTVLNSNRTGKLEAVFSYTEKGNSDTMSFRPNTVNNMNAVKAPLCFSSWGLSEVLKANLEFRNPILKVSDSGLASISFSEKDLDSEYYFSRIAVNERLVRFRSFGHLILRE